jgi:hypothetical protein
MPHIGADPGRVNAQKHLVIRWRRLVDVPELEDVG